MIIVCNRDKALLDIFSLRDESLEEFDWRSIGRLRSLWFKLFNTFKPFKSLKPLRSQKMVAIQTLPKKSSKTLKPSSNNSAKS